MKYIKMNKNLKVMVSDEDFDLVSAYKWHLHGTKKNQYAISFVKKSRKKKILMHRLILNLTDPKILIDHKNGNGLDNRRENIRICNASENTINTKKYIKGNSEYKGVRYFKGGKRTKRWYAEIIQMNKRIYLGSFLTEIEAAKAYNEKAKELFGGFAYLNNL